MSSFAIVLTAVATTISASALLWFRHVDRPIVEWAWTDNKPSAWMVDDEVRERPERGRESVTAFSLLSNVGDGVAHDCRIWAPQGLLLVWKEGVTPTETYVRDLSSMPRFDRPEDRPVTEIVPIFASGASRIVTVSALKSGFSDLSIHIQWRERRRLRKGWCLKTKSWQLKDLLLPPL